MNFFLRQSITGLLRHAADTIPETREAGIEIAEHLDRILSVRWLDRAFDLFQQAAFVSRDPVFVTGAVWTVQAMNEVSRYQRKTGLLVDDDTANWPPARAQTGLPAAAPERAEDHVSEDDPIQADLHDLAAREAERGVAELFDRIRMGASLEEALALFPHIGDELEDT